jgi:hypothetical protein
MTNIQKLLAKTVDTCLKNNIGFYLINDTHVQIDNNIKCSGYFDEDDLKVAIKKPEEDWLPILVHESCHLDQFLEKSVLWAGGECGINTIDSWLQGKEFNKIKLQKSFEDTIKLELDCEKRSLQKIKKFKLRINTLNYIQRVNAYLFSYWATYRDRKWYPFPYNNPRIYKRMPEKILSLNFYLDKNSDFLKYY